VGAAGYNSFLFLTSTPLKSSEPGIKEKRVWKVEHGTLIFHAQMDPVVYK